MKTTSVGLAAGLPTSRRTFTSSELAHDTRDAYVIRRVFIFTFIYMLHLLYYIIFIILYYICFIYHIFEFNKRWVPSKQDCRCHLILLHSQPSIVQSISCKIESQDERELNLGELIRRLQIDRYHTQLCVILYYICFIYDIYVTVIIFILYI